MDRRLIMLVIGLVFGTGFGFLMAASQGTTLGGAAMDHAADGADHDHAAMQPVILKGESLPTVSARLLRDPVAGWNLQLDVTNFAFAPQNAGLAHVEGEGHAHVYVNDVKVARLYGPWFHLDHLPAGDVRIEVGLYANDHRTLVVRARPVRAMIDLQN